VVRGHAYSPIRYQGQYADDDTGLHYNRHRYYDPATGLYQSPDPIGLDGGLRPYGYVQNPTGWIDPLGLAGKFGSGFGTHHAAVTVERDGRVIFSKQYESGHMTDAEKALGHPLASLATHTEVRACSEVPLQAGDIMRFTGELGPCTPCKGVMNRKVEDNPGARVIYDWPEGTWEAGPEAKKQRDRERRQRRT
jgi:RHS repeat-associated protein